MRGLPGILASAAVALFAPADGANAATAQQTINRLNTQRAANGLPAGITEDATWSQRCALHDHYMAANHVFTHEESVGGAGYTDAGARAGENAVLTQGVYWDSGDPYEWAPLHLNQLLAPRLATVGTADVDGYSCTTTFPGWTGPGPAAPTVYTYPGGGTTVYPSETAAELPWTPGQLVGVSPGTTTGPYLLVLVDAPGAPPAAIPATVSSASLTGPSGRVAVTWADGTTPTPAGSGYPTLANYISPGAFIIPLTPLAAGAVYHAHVVIEFAGNRIVHDWSFATSEEPGTGQPTSAGQPTGGEPSTTGARPFVGAQSAAWAQSTSSLTIQGLTLGFSSRSPAPIRIAFSRANGAHAPSVTIAPNRSTPLRLAPGRWMACGHQGAAAGFATYDQCVTITITGVPALSLATPRVRGHQVSIDLRLSPVLRGRRATLTLTSLAISCRRGRCQWTPGRSFKRTIALGRKPLRLSLPSPWRGIRLTLNTSAFKLGDARWTGASANASFVRGG